MTSSNVSISDMSISIYQISDIPVFLPAPQPFGWKDITLFVDFLQNFQKWQNGRIFKKY
jgi:uncharacterized protein (DUF779 family)